MLYSLKSVILFGLMAATGLATPMPAEAGSLVARAKVPDTAKCETTEFTKANINQALSNSHTQHGDYPKQFFNKDTGGKPVFDNITPTNDNKYYEYPLVTGDAGYTGGAPGKYRVVMNKNYGYVGLTKHVGSGNDISKCP